MRNAFLSTLSQPPTPKTSTRPQPTCPASSRQGPDCSPARGCRGVGLPVGTCRLPRLGGRDFLPGGSRRSPRSRGFMAEFWERVPVNDGHSSWTRVIFQAPVACQELLEFTGISFRITKIYWRIFVECFLIPALHLICAQPCARMHTESMHEYICVYCPQSQWF